MNLLYAFAIAAIAGCGVYMILSRHVVRIILGVSVLSIAVNLVIFYAGRIVSQVPPVIPGGENALAAEAANPLPQALILTAIVIGFALTAYVAALALQIQRSIGTLDNAELDVAERLGTPFDEDRA
ncbi:sodium:proton antiporter [Aureimonas mangrovi]|uniref:sodium:proton antiporter n=1 Tax=Aureimonas mangrovi TaxID=2758041 RepID=UPI00163DDF98|nr:NADH-quinone oxidoreductase subunit K [Aureimonas mangrovi]